MTDGGRASEQRAPESGKHVRLGVECAAVAVALVALYAALHPDPVRSLGSLYDDVVYASIGRSIATGGGYRSAHLVGAPVHEKFPPGVPLVYALCWAVGGTLRSAMALAMALTVGAVAAAGALLSRYARQSLGCGRLTTATLVVLPLAMQSSIRYYSGGASEPWFLLGWAGALALAARDDGEMSNARALALGLVLAAAALFRTQAVVLLPAMLAALTLRRVPWRRVAVVGAAAILPLVAWQLWLAARVAAGPRAAEADQRGYLSWVPVHSPVGALRFVIGVVAHNVVAYAAVAPGVVGGGSAKMLLFVFVVLALAIAGAVRVRRSSPELGLTLLAFAAVVLAWPFVQDRFVIAMMPVLGVAAASGASALLSGRTRLVRAFAATAGAGVALYAWRGVPARAAIGLRGPSARDTLVDGALFQQRTDEVVRWVAANTRPDDRVMAEGGGVIYLRTGRRTVVGVPEEPYTGPTVMRPVGRYLARYVLDDSVDYVVVWRYKSPALLAQVGRAERECPGSLEPIAPVMPTSAPQFVRYFRVHRDERCLRAVAEAGGAPRPIDAR